MIQKTAITHLDCNIAYLDEEKVLDKGRTMGLEPTNGGTTIHCLNHLATPAITLNHHNIAIKN
jgi:hypothetical protein